MSRPEIDIRPIRLRTPITAYELHEALTALDIVPIAALKDPIVAMRRAASADIQAVNHFLRVVLRSGQALDLTAYDDEDEARLFAAAVLARVLVQARKSRADRPSSPRIAPAIV